MTAHGLRLGQNGEMYAPAITLESRLRHTVAGENPAKSPARRTLKAGLADLEDMLASAQPTEKQLELRARQLKLKYELIKQRL